MALQIEVDNLTKDELLFELQARGLDVNPNNTVDDLKLQFKSAKGTLPDNTKANTFISGLSIDDEFQVCEEKLDAVLLADHASSSCRRRCLSKLSHLILRHNYKNFKTVNLDGGTNHLGLLLLIASDCAGRFVLRESPPRIGNFGVWRRKLYPGHMWRRFSIC